MRTKRVLFEHMQRHKEIRALFPDAHYELKSFAIDEKRNNFAAYAVFRATRTGQGGPVPPTGKRMSTDYVYIMQFRGEKIVHMTKVWNASPPPNSLCNPMTSSGRDV